MGRRFSLLADGIANHKSPETIVFRLGSKKIESAAVLTEVKGDGRHL